MTDQADDVVTLARQVCTPGQFDVVDLVERGWSQRKIALHLGISRSTVRSREEEARRRIAAARRGM